MKQAKMEEMEALIQKLDGVIAVKLVPNDDDKLAEVHVLADRLKNPKQLSRDIQSAVSAAFGYTISHSIISIAQIEEEAVREKTAPGRLKISGFHISYADNEFSAAVTLEIGGQKFDGSSRNTGRTGSRTRNMAVACVNAVNGYLENEAFSFYDIQRVTVGAYTAVVVAVTYSDSSRNDRILTGTSIIRDDEYFSAIRAVLDAVNRILPQLGAK